jgi:hypothetical protein
MWNTLQLSSGDQMGRRFDVLLHSPKKNLI